jgi:Rrf2 family protein
VNLSAKTEYACIAVLELAINYGGDPVRIRSIAETHGVPSRFLVQILLQLKGAGIVASTRGAAGGYRLVRDPSELTLAEVMAVIDGRNDPVSNASAETPGTRTLLEVWRRAADARQELLSRTSFAELVERVRGRTDNMYYI